VTLFTVISTETLEKVVFTDATDPYSSMVKVASWRRHSWPPWALPGCV